MISPDTRPRAQVRLEQVIPQGVRDELRLRGASRLRGGGTPAQVYLCEDDDDRAVVVKVLRAGVGSVDGHDLDSFLRKPLQISRIHRDLPGLSPYYVPIVGQWHGNGWGAYAMPWIEGDAPIALIGAETHGKQRFLETLRLVFEVLGTHGYANSVVPAPPGHGIDTYLGRVMRRLPLLERHLSAARMEGVYLRVNGRLVPTIRELLRRVTVRDDVLATVQPAQLYYPVHGDLNLGNLMIHTSANSSRGEIGLDYGPEFTVLDPRGIVAHWDPVYDAAKALFSLTLFEAAMGDGFEISSDGPSGYDVRLRSPVSSSASLAAELPAVLTSVDFFREISRRDPRWRRRLLYSHAFHVLAEAACRLSDQTMREFHGKSGLAARREVALGLYLSGLLLLDDLLRGPASPEDDPAAHLACLATVNQVVTS